MDAEKYLEHSNSIEMQIASLKGEQKRLTERYYRENAPKFEEGSIVKVFFKDGDTIKGFLQGFIIINGTEFRPELFNVKNGVKRKRMRYFLSKEIDHIERIGDCARCKNCLFAKIKGSRVYCSVKLFRDSGGKYHCSEISMDKIACEDISFVVWKDGIPYHAKYQCGKEPKLTGGHYLAGQTIESDTL